MATEKKILSKSLKIAKLSEGPTKENPGPMLPTSANAPEMDVMASYPRAYM